MTRWSRWLWVFLVIAALLVLSLVGDNYLLRLGTNALMFASLAMAWNFIGGFAGYPSFGAAAFFGFGAYASAIAHTQGMPQVLSWMFAALLAALLALVLGFALLRMRGHAFAIATLVVAEVLREVANGWTGLTGGGMGLNLPFSGLSPEAGARYFFYAMLALACLAFAATVHVSNHRFGFGLRCIKQNESAADMVGVNTTALKVMAFTLSGAFTAAVGAIYASWVSYIEPTDVFDITISIKAIVMVLLGGVGTVMGPLIGAVAFLALDELVWRNFLQLHTGILGVVIVVLVLFLPSGLAAYSLPALWRRLFRKKEPA